MRALLAALALLIGLLVAPPAHAAADTNLAAGRSATAGSFTDVYRAANVTDGNQATYWESANNAFPQWVQVDLGASASVSKLVLKLPSGWPVRTQTLSVQGSTNGSTFSTIAASATHTFDPAATITFGTTTTRYVRLQITANSGWPAGQLSEFEVWGSPLGNPGGGTNLALGKAMAASSHTQSYVAANANDDNVQTYWEGAAYPGTLTAQLGANADLTSITLKLNPDPVWARRTQTIQVLGREQSATAFTTLVPQATYTFDPATGNTVTIPVTAKAADVRLQITANTGAPGGQIAEFQIFGTPAANPDLTVTNLTWSPASPTATTAITLSSTVKNAGTAASAATSVNFYAGATKVGTAAVGALAAGASTSVSVNIGTRRPGTYQLSAKADEEGEVVEQNESNNTFTAPASLEVAEAPGPDLQIVGVSATPPNPAIGERVTFTVAVKNRGTSTTGATTVTRVAVGGTTLDTQTPPIAAGATANVAVGGGWTATSGGATITATADATDAVDETDEDNNTHSQQIAVGRGASVPYVEYEAESAVYQGTLLQSDPLRTYGHTNFATESSGRKSVRLNSTGQYVEFTSRNQANSIVVRNSIPDAPGGGGIEATISLYADGTFVRKLTLSSRHSWLYGTSDDPEALTNTPQADARRLFDESHALLSRSYPPGTKFRIQRDADDTAAFYIIDLIDLEQVAPRPSALPNAPPSPSTAPCPTTATTTRPPSSGRSRTTRTASSTACGSRRASGGRRRRSSPTTR
ncbi:CARDB domain-containing protein [Thermocatellispora tengchongensis]|uniref:CARDB domain-containing protein n=1 Tax=Thermocatellispora tengchongensis TaxID=1073253 RepID=UPI0036432E0B